VKPLAARRFPGIGKWDSYYDLDLLQELPSPPQKKSYRSLCSGFPIGKIKNHQQTQDEIK
jgi:hypothetical protein